MSSDARRWLEKEVLVEEIEIPANLQRRTYDGDALRELARDIETVGLLQRVVVVPRGDRYELVAGYRRLMAHRLLGRAKIEVRIPNANVETVARMTFSENYLREAIDPLDEGEWFRSLMKAENITQRELSARLGRSESYVSSRLALLEMPSYIQEALRDGVLGIRMAGVISRCRNDAERRRIVNIVRENGASENVVQYWVDEANAADDRLGSDFEEREFVASTDAVYRPPEVFCDLCEKPADHMSSRFVRVCADCFAVSKGNLGPKR